MLVRAAVRAGGGPCISRTSRTRQSTVVKRRGLKARPTWVGHTSWEPVKNGIENPIGEWLPLWCNSWAELLRLANLESLICV